jgi:hypothetical protein
MPNSGRKRDSLITAETSLIARFNSLQARKKFPARMRRELARKKLIACPLGYEISILPKVGVPQRADFVLNALAE